MAASRKKKTTIARLNQERGLAERGAAKQARKAARKQAATHDEQAAAPSPEQEAAQPLANQAAIGAATRAFGDMAKTDEKTRREKSA
jgi:hypothetical protein